MSERLPQELLEGIPEELHPQVIGKFTVMQALDFPPTQERRITIARNEQAEKSFVAGIMKSWRGVHGNGKGLCGGDIELLADELGVLEDIFPELKETVNG